VAPTLAVLTRHRDFRYLFLAELVMFGGDWFALIPLITLLEHLTGSGLPGAIALAADTAVNALVLPFAGIMADRLDRRKILIVANLGSIAAISLLFLVRSPGLAWIGPVAIGLAAAAKAFYSPAAGAALPNLVPPADLPAANALGGSAWGTMLVVGASIGGILSTAFGPYVCFAITVGTLLVSAFLVWRVRRPMQVGRDATVAEPRPFRAMRDALGYIRHNPRVLSLVTVKSAVGVGNGVLGLFPILAGVVFAVGPLGTGLLFAARGLGALVGPLILRRVLSRSSWLLPGLAVSMAVYGFAYLGVSISAWFWLVVPLVAVAHLSGGANWTLSNYALQIEVPDSLRGRVFATDQMIVTLAMSFSLLFAGALSDHLNPRIPIAICASFTLVYGVIWRLATRRLMRNVAPPALAVPAAEGPPVAAI
jgi:MFS family permease